MALYHFSEDPCISAFKPHRAPTSLSDALLVWAIDAWHAPMYFAPRDCPRACFWPGAETTVEDREHWFGAVEARMVIAIESTWLERLRTTALYRYTMPEAGFVLHDSTAGHWVAHETIEPLSVEPIGDLLTALSEANVELRITPSLIQLWERVTRSSLAFSGTRLRNAQGYSSLHLP